MTLLLHLGESTLYAALAALLAFVLKDAPARIRHVLWLSASFKFLVPCAPLVALGTSVGAWTLPNASPPIAGAIRWLDAAWSRWTVGAAAPPVSSALPQNLQDVASVPLLVVWAAGVIALVAWRCRQWRQVSALMQTATPFDDDRVAAALARLRRRSGAKDDLTLMPCDTACEPAVIGIRHPKLLWPHGLSERLTDDELDAILAHELCHVRRRDNLRALLHVVIECVCWFHPMVWWIGARLVSERERACDEEVVQMGADKHDYARAILNVCGYSLRAPAALAATVGGANLSRRIARILTRQTAPRTTAWTRFVIGGACVAAAGLPLGIGVLNAHRAPVDAAVFGMAAATSAQDREVHRLPGGDITWPKLLQEVKPVYTPEAMQARVQGVVALEAIIVEDGTVEDVEVVGSLDTDYGLDDAAVEALKQWRFTPALKDGKPVAVLVPVEMSFTLK